MRPYILALLIASILIIGCLLPQNLPNISVKGSDIVIQPVNGSQNHSGPIVSNDTNHPNLPNPAPQSNESPAAQNNTQNNPPVPIPPAANNTTNKYEPEIMNVSLIVGEGNTALVSCGDGYAISSYASTYGINCPSSGGTSCGKCSIGANYCTVVFNNDICGDACVGTVKEGELILVCKRQPGASDETPAEPYGKELITSDCGTPSDNNYKLQYSTKYWDIYAYDATWKAHKDDYLNQINFPDQVYEQLSSRFDAYIVNYTTSHKLYLLIRQEQNSGGFATGCIGEIGKGPGIGVSYEAWYNPYGGSDNWATELIAHETGNVFTGRGYMGGWPVDWWADHISPFPYSQKILVEEATGHIAAANASLERADPLTFMFLYLDWQYPGIYSRMFDALKADGWVSWFGPNPSKRLGTYVAAYLSIAANTSMANVLNKGFGQEAITTRAIDYTIDENEMNRIIDMRNQLQSQPRDSECWEKFRQGQYDAAGCP